MRLVQAKYKPDSLSKIRQIYNESIIPRLQTMPGCLCVCLIKSELQTDEGISLTLWDSKEQAEDYEKSTGKVVIERFAELDPMEMPGVLVVNHGAFTWGKSPDEAVLNASILENIAKMAWGTLLLDPKQKGIPESLLGKHFHRKHGPDAYYGQNIKGEKK